MTESEIVDQAAALAKKRLAEIAASGNAGSVVVSFHRDSSRIKKVLLSTEESWIIPQDSSEKR